jgi:DNA-binding CsgD family transcriptional regulator
MEILHIIVAEKSQLVRMGLIGVLNQTGYPLNIREITDTAILKNTLYKDHKGLLIISKSFMKTCTPEIIRLMLLKPKKYYILLINNDVADNMSFLDFNEIIEPYDAEKIIFRKIEKFIHLLSNPQHISKSTGEISNREKEVLKLVALGLTNKEIAEKLFISTYTVITHRKNITSKLGIKTIAGLTVYAIINKLIAAEETI